MSGAGGYAASAAIRSHSWWLLARFLQEPPRRDWIEAAADFYAAAARQLDPELAPVVSAFAASLQALGADADLEPLAVEHTRLFAGLRQDFGPPAIESAVREGRMLGDSTAAAAIAYAEAGLPGVATEGSPPDHAATELRFLALCAHEEARAWAEDRERDAQAWLRRQRGFVERRVARWLPDYCEDRARVSTVPCLRDGLLALAALCRADREDLQALEEGAESAALA